MVKTVEKKVETEEMEFQILPPEIFETLNMAPKPLSKIAEALTRGEKVFVRGASDKHSHRLAQYYGFAKSRGKKFSMRKRTIDNIEGYVCLFEDIDASGE